MAEHRLTWWQRNRLRKQLHLTHDAHHYRRILALLEYDRGEPISRIAERLGVCQRSVHYWIASFKQASDPQILRDALRPGRPARWTEQTTRWLEQLLATSPGQWGYIAVDWTMPLLSKTLARGTGQHFSRITLWRALRRLDYVWKRPRHALTPDPEREKKTPYSSPIAPNYG